MSTGKAKKSAAAENERISLRISLLRKGWTYRKLAKRIKCHPGTIANLFCGDNNWWGIRAKINKALGEPIFTEPAATAAGQSPVISELQR